LYFPEQQQQQQQPVQRTGSFFVFKQEAVVM
jgi:hypothetical protein